MSYIRFHKGSVIVAAAVVVLSALLLTRFFMQTSDAVRDLHVIRVARGDLDITLRTVGVLDAARTYMVSSAIRGDKGKIIYLVEDGATVAESDVMVRLDPTPFETEISRLGGDIRSLEAAVDSAGQMLEWEKNQMEREIRRAEFELKVSELELRRLVEGEGPLQLAQYKSELEKAKEEYERYQGYILELEQLQKDGFGNPGEVALARKKVEELEHQFQTARKRYESYKEHVLPTSVEAARAKVDKAGIEIQQVKKGTAFKVARAEAALGEIEAKLQTAQTALQRALAELEKTTLKAPFGGIAILYETFRDGQKRKPRVGDVVWQNQPLLYLPDISTMIVKSRIREVDLHKVAVDQACTVQVDAYPEKRFSGKITTIGMLADERFESGIGEKYFQFTVTLNGENALLRPGMTARMAVEAQDATDVLYVPVHAIFSDGAQKFCYLSDNQGRFRKKKVVAGRQNEDMVEIVSGLEEGDLVSLLRPAAEQVVGGER